MFKSIIFITGITLAVINTFILYYYWQIRSTILYLKSTYKKAEYDKSKAKEYDSFLFDELFVRESGFLTSKYELEIATIAKIAREYPRYTLSDKVAMTAIIHLSNLLKEKKEVDQENISSIIRLCELLKKSPSPT